MSEQRRYRCENCGKRFQIEVLTPEEVRRARKEGRPTSAISPPAGAGQPPGQQRTPEDREKRRKEMLDRTTPEFRALMDQYRHDMEARRQQRGLPAVGPPGAKR